MFKPSSDCLTDRSKAVLLLLIIFVICVSYHTVLSVPCSLVVSCCGLADLLALLSLMFSCVFVTFPYGVLDQVRVLIVSNPDLYLRPNFGGIYLKVLYTVAAISSTIARPLGLHYNHYVSPSVRPLTVSENVHYS